MSKKTYSAHEIEQAFRMLREQLAAEFGVKDAEADVYRIRDIERDMMAILQRNERTAAPQRQPKRTGLAELRAADLDAFNDAIFG